MCALGQGEKGGGGEEEEEGFLTFGNPLPIFTETVITS